MANTNVEGHTGDWEDPRLHHADMEDLTEPKNHRRERLCEAKGTSLECF